MTRLVKESPLMPKERAYPTVYYIMGGNPPRKAFVTHSTAEAVNYLSRLVEFRRNQELINPNHN